MDTMTFLVNGTETGHNDSAAWVTVTAAGNGVLVLKVAQSGTMGKLCGVFFDVHDAEILGSLIVNSDSRAVLTNQDALSHSRNGTDNGPVIADEHYNTTENCDVGVKIDETRVSRKDVRSYSFTLRSTKRELALSDFSNIRLDYAGSVNNDDNDTDTCASFDHSHNWVYMCL